MRGGGGGWGAGLRGCCKREETEHFKKTVTLLIVLLNQ